MDRPPSRAGRVRTRRTARTGPAPRSRGKEGPARGVGHHVVRDPALDPHDLQRLAVRERVDVDRRRFELRTEVNSARCGGSRSFPSRAGPCAHAVEHRADIDRPLTAGFDPAPGRLEHDREVALHERGHLREQPAQAVVLVGDLLAVVQHEGDVETRLRAGEIVGQGQENGETAFHVGGSEAVEHVTVAAGRGVAVRGDGVEMAAEHDPLRPAELGARHHVGPDALDLQRSPALAQARLDHVGERGFGAAHRRDLAERLGQREEIVAHETMPCSRRIAFNCSLSWPAPSGR